MNANSDAMTLIRAEFERASGQVRAGDLASAEWTCRQALQRFPGENNLSCLLGAVLIRLQRPEEAESLLRDVVSRVPEFARAHDELANALLAQDMPEEAIPSLERLMVLEPGNALAQRKLDEIRSRQEAERPSATALPDVEELLLQAELKRSSRRFREAETLCQQAIAKEPENAEAYHRLGQLAIEQGHFGDARVLLQRAVELDPERVGAWRELGTVNLELGSFDEAVTALKTAIDREPGAGSLHGMLGAALSRSGRYEEAVAAFETAAKLNPASAGVALGLGHTMRTIGRQGEAVAAYRRALEADPGCGEAYWSIANLKQQLLRTDDIDVMQQQIARDDLDDKVRVFLWFALGKAFEDKADFDQAFRYFQEGNKLKRMSESYDPVETQAGIDKLIRVFNADLLARPAASSRTGQTPIFIVGLPRSGSTLVEQILASHNAVTGTRELVALDRIVAALDRQSQFPEIVTSLESKALLELRDQYLENTRMYRGDSAFFTDKAPGNFRHIGLIHLLLPNAKIIDVRRHPLDSCMGCYKQLFASGQPFAYDLFELGEYYLEYDRLMGHWHDRLPNKVLTVSYEDLVNDLRGQVARILDFCGLPMQEACVEFHRTARPIESASSEQVRQPIYDSAVEHWRNYEPHLEDLIEALRPVLPAG